MKDAPLYFRPFLKLFKHFYPKIGTKSLKHNDFGQLLDRYTYNFEVDHLSWTTPTNPEDFDECLVLSIGCLDKNIERMFDLLTDLFTNPNFADYSHMSNLLKIFSSEAANSFVEDSLGYALSYAAGGLRRGIQRTEKLTESRFICNLGSSTLKTTMVKMILQEIERHMMGVVGYIFRRVFFFS
jgi:Zn-dependent M16 (insulinase) family peptidase